MGGGAHGALGEAIDQGAACTHHDQHLVMAAQTRSATQACTLAKA